MILTYHKVSPFSPTHWWVDVDTFRAQMAALQDREVVYLADYDPSNPRHVVISFDGVYECVWQHAMQVLQEFGYVFELFVVGDLVGELNIFDEVEPIARFASLLQLDDLVKAGGRLQWHTRTHQPLAQLSSEAFEAELDVLPELASRFPAPHFRWFAYPNGAVDDRTDGAARLHFDGAVTTDEAVSLDRFKYGRKLVFKETNLGSCTLSVIIPNYNYGPFLTDAIESVLAQSVAPDEILVIDDGSTDGSDLVLKEFKDKVRIIQNVKNMGIVACFNKAVSLTKGDYIVFVGADNRVRYDFVEKHLGEFRRDPSLGVVYCDIVLFGPRARLQAERLADNPIFKVRRIYANRGTGEECYQWHLPDPTPELIANMMKVNFVHGSSMFRRDAFLAAGGYLYAEGVAEDKSLFHRMLTSGWNTKHVALPLLEYRQHSRGQANRIAGNEAALRALVQENRQLRHQLDQICKIVSGNAD